MKHSLEIYKHNKIEKILKRILDRVIAFSIQKFSSSVIELCITQTNEEWKLKFLEQIFKQHFLVDLMCNKFGTFVLLTALA
jgi:hypothetical protein